jgi:hypothetical protein
VCRREGERGKEGGGGRVGERDRGEERRGEERRESERESERGKELFCSRVQSFMLMHSGPVFCRIQ